MRGAGGGEDLNAVRDLVRRASRKRLRITGRVCGQVILQAVVHKDGTVGDVTVLKSPGARLGFDESAIEAVKQWRYKPYLLNGSPVEVETTVDVNFSLSGG